MYKYSVSKDHEAKSKLEEMKAQTGGIYTSKSHECYDRHDRDIDPRQRTSSLMMLLQ